jgi:hypothetical protein
MAGSITQSAPQSWVQLLSSELNSLANNTAVGQNTGVNAAYNNGSSGNRYFLGDFELRVTFASAPTNGATLDLYLMPLSSDGSAFADFSTTDLPLGLYVGSFVVRNVATAQVLFLRGVPLPDDQFIVGLFNNGTGQSLPGSGSTVKFKPAGEAYT